MACNSDNFDNKNVRTRTPRLQLKKKERNKRYHGKERSKYFDNAKVNRLKGPC